MIIYFYVIIFLLLSIYIIQNDTFLTNIHREHFNFQTLIAAINVKGSFRSKYPEQPSFFPRSLEELATDTADSTQVGLINSMKRMRIDIRMRLVRREKNMLKWLVLTCSKLVDSEFKFIHIFLEDRKDLDMCNEFWKDIVNYRKKQNDTIDTKNELKQMSFSSIDDSYFREELDNQIVVIFNPDNIIEGSNPNLLDNVQCLCFKAALKRIPVIMINPELIAHAWNNVGPRPPLLLGDFPQIYFACDDYFAMPTKHQWAGIVTRAGTGTDLFLLNGLSPGKQSPNDFICVNSWSEGLPDDIRGALVTLLRKNTGFQAMFNSTTSSSFSLSSLINNRNRGNNDNNVR